MMNLLSVQCFKTRPVYLREGWMGGTILKNLDPMIPVFLREAAKISSQLIGEHTAKRAVWP